MLPGFNDLHPGMVFSYNGPRRFPAFRRGIAIGLILAVDPEWGIIHIRTYKDVGGEPLVDIQHLPMLFSAFRKSLDSIVRSDPLKENAHWETLNLWRRRARQGEVGGFAREIWKVENDVHAVAAEAHPPEETSHIVFAFPTKNAKGAFSKIEVEVARKA
jgi:hypothetical protein